VSVPVRAERSLPPSAPAEILATNPGLVGNESVSDYGIETGAGAPGPAPVARPDPGVGTELWAGLAPAQQPDEIGRLERYRVLQVIGQGGMGVVYLAEDPDLHRKVALKAMLPGLAANPTARQRFLREARTAAAIEHDHIVPIFQVGEDRGIPFIAMPLLRGESLEGRLRREGILPPAEVVRIGRETARGLGAAHAAGLVHRDIKPANLWIEGEPGVSATGGRVKILDFGLARAAADGAQLTQQGAIVGTPSYMAPEQGRGETVDARCDLWSLGVVLYRMCTGKNPFHGTDTLDALLAVALKAPTPPAQHNTAVPAALSELIMKLLVKDPAQRIASAAEVEQTLAQLEKELQLTQEFPAPNLSAPPQVAPAPKAPGPRTGRRKRFLVALGGLAAACLLAGMVLFRQPSEGVVRIEIPDSEIQVVLDRTGATFRGADMHEIKVRTGEHGLLVRRGDLEFETDRFTLKKGETVLLKVELLPDRILVLQGERVIGTKATPVAEKGVTDYREIHDAEEPRFDAWIAQMKTDGFRPVSLSVKTVKDAPRYTAVAIKEEKKTLWMFDRVSNDAEDYVEGWWEKHYDAAAFCLYRDKGKLWEAYLWVVVHSMGNDGIWHGTRDFILDKIDDGKERSRLIYESAIEGEEGPIYAVVLGKPGGPATVTSTNQSLEICKDWLEKKKAEGWRPVHLYAYGSGPKTLFGGILLQDAKGPDWETSWSLTAEQYSAELAARKRQGFRPHTIVPHDNEAGALRFSIVWVRYRTVS
jgi:hypothetical protein